MPGSRRNPASQSKHDRTVRAKAKDYLGKGYDVQADVPGYQSPPAVGGHIPDLIVKKGGDKTIIEVETPDSVNTPHALEQDAAFRRARRRSENTHYKKIITK